MANSEKTTCPPPKGGGLIFHFLTSQLVIKVLFENADKSIFAMMETSTVESAATPFLSKSTFKTCGMQKSPFFLLTIASKIYG